MNRPDGTLEVVEYDQAWPDRFDVERDLLEKGVPDLFLSVEHVGSTSVPGMPAKPTIDVLAVARDLAEIVRRAPALAEIGYEHRPHGPPDDRDHAFFRKVRGGKRLVHLHVVAADSPLAEDYRTFRDWLRAEPDAADRYAAIKRDLAARYADRRQDYVDVKQGEVDVLMDEARRWRATPGLAGT